MQEETILYRLDIIENSIAELKNVLTDNKLQSKDIEDIKNKVADHDKRIVAVEQAPIKDKAQMWTTITDMIFKAVATAVIGYVLIKIGLRT